MLVDQKYGLIVFEHESKQELGENGVCGNFHVRYLVGRRLIPCSRMVSHSIALSRIASKSNAIMAWVGFAITWNGLGIISLIIVNSIHFHHISVLSAKQEANLIELSLAESYFVM